MCYQAVNPPDVFYQGENMIVIKGQQFDFSFFNAGDIEKWIAGRNKVAEKYNDIKKYRSNNNYTLEKYKDLLTECCNIIFDLFDDTLGEGASNKIFGEKCDFEQCVDAYVEFESRFTESQKNFSDKIACLTTPVGEKGK